MPEITKSRIEMAFSTDRIVWLMLALLVLGVYFCGLNIPLVGPDEPRYAQVAREMFERGDWVTPTLGGFNWFEKPALLYWLEIVFFKVFGVSEFAARFGSALFGVGTVASLWVLGWFYREAESKRSRDSSTLANWLALVSASTLGIIVFAHGASFDIILTFPMTAALVGFFVFDTAPAGSTPNRVYLPLVLFYFFVGVSLLAKGLIGGVFPAGIVLFYYLLSWKWPRRPFLLSLLWGTALSVLVAATWYVPMYIRHGYAFIDEFFIQHHFQRYTSNKYFHPQPYYFFLWVLPLMSLPWVPFFLAAFWRRGTALLDREHAEGDIENGQGGSSRAPDSSLFRFALAWMIVPLVFFSFSGSKLPGYILPAVPAVVIIAAEYLYSLAREKQKWRVIAQALAATTFVVVVGLMTYVVPDFADADSVKGLIAAADKRGFGDARVLSLHTVSHNAEFYAAGRIVRDPDGKQRKFLGPLEVLDQLRHEGGRPLLVLVPLEYVRQVTASPEFRSEVLMDNGGLAIAAVMPLSN